jgi:Tfp pilus assembly protein PilP
MKLIAAILLAGMMTGSALAQNPNIIANTQAKMNTVQQKKTADSNEALGINNAQSAKSPYNSAKTAPHKNSPVHQTSAGVGVENASTTPDQPQEPRAINVTGRRDPFISPVVSRSMAGSGCSTGKRCLAIDQINLRGVVKSDDGMIAVVVNALDKAYFLHENDPVFNGYVVRITGDSVIFKESVQDKFGKPFTREVTKKIFTPAV